MPTSLLTPTVLHPLLISKDYMILHLGKHRKMPKENALGIYIKKAKISQDRKKISSCCS